MNDKMLADRRPSTAPRIARKVLRIAGLASALLWPLSQRTSHVVAQGADVVVGFAAQLAPAAGPATQVQAIGQGPKTLNLPANVPILRLRNGDRLTGQLAPAAAPGQIRWQTSLFATPLDFATEAISSIQYPLPAKPPTAEGEFCFELAEGDLIYGDLIGVTADNLQIRSARFGELTLQRSEVRRFFRAADGGLVHSGPTGFAGWKLELLKDAQENTEAQVRVLGPNGQPLGPLVPPPDLKTLWREQAGQPTTTQPGAALRGEFTLPTRAMIELELRWEKKADFVVIVGGGPDAAADHAAFRLEVWRDQLVALRDVEERADLQAIMKLQPGAGRAELRICRDADTNRLLVLSRSGSVLANLHVPPGANAKNGDNLVIANHFGDVRVERCRVSHWNGEVPQASDSSKANLQRRNGTLVYAELVAFDPQTKQVTVTGPDGEQKQPLAEFNTFVVSPAVVSPPTDPSANNAKKSTLLRVTLADGSRVRGTPTAWSATGLTLSHPGISTPLAIRIADLRSLDSLGEVTPTTNSQSEIRRGRLVWNEGELHGGLANGQQTDAASCLFWKADGAVVASPLRRDASAQIVYREPPSPEEKRAGRTAVPQVAPPQGGILGRIFGGGVRPEAAASPAPAHSMFLRAGDAFPYEDVTIDEKGVTFKSKSTEVKFLPHDQLKAIELSANGPPPPLSKTKRARLLTLPRLQRESPPTHLVRFVDGDYLRGRLVSLDEQKLTMEVRLDVKQIDRRQVSHIIWLHPEELTGPAGSANEQARSNGSPAVAPAVAASKPEGAPQPTQPAETPVVPPPAKPVDSSVGLSVQVKWGNGIRLTFEPLQIKDGTLSGPSRLLGQCHVDLNSIDQLWIGREILSAASDLPYHSWRLTRSPDPRAVQDDSSTKPGSRLPGTESPLVGKPAPSFKLPLLEGGTFDLETHRGKVVVLDFWATWCGPCLRSMPLIERVVKEMPAESGVELYAVNLEETARQIKPMLERHKLTPTVVLDQDGAVAAKYSATAIPQTVIIDRDGNVVRLFVGGGNQFEQDLRDALRQVLGLANTPSGDNNIPGGKPAGPNPPAEKPPAPPAKPIGDV